MIRCVELNAIVGYSELKVVIALVNTACFGRFTDDNDQMEDTTDSDIEKTYC